MGLTPSFSEWTKMRLRATSRPVSLQVDLWTSLRNRGESCLVSVSCLLNRERVRAYPNVPSPSLPAIGYLWTSLVPLKGRPYASASSEVERKAPGRRFSSGPTESASMRELGTLCRDSC